MKRRKFIAWFLLVVCMVMLTASVLPHHHHHDILCMQFEQEMEAGDECCQHSHSCNDCGETPTSQEACKSDCVTNFCSVSPDRSVDSFAPLYAFCVLLFMLDSVFTFLLSLTKVRNHSCFFEKLHPTCIPSIKGLRAPPTI